LYELYASLVVTRACMARGGERVRTVIDPKAPFRLKW
jgi:hypothetical protein